jgi:hypothetical protein
LTKVAKNFPKKRKKKIKRGRKEGRKERVYIRICVSLEKIKIKNEMDFTLSNNLG